MTATQGDIAALNSLIENDVEEEGTPPPPTVYPTDPSVTLNLGLWTPQGLLDTAEVRELNGYDEEAMAKAPSLGHAMQIALERATVRIGNHEATRDDLDELSVGDRMELMLAIRRVTWGEEITVEDRCDKCRTEQEIDIDVAAIPRVAVKDKVSDRQFDLELSRGTARFTFPSGRVHKAMLTNKYESNPQAVTAVIVDCAVDTMGIGIPVMTEAAAKKLSIQDRKTISEYMSKHNPGPRMDDIKYPCVACGEENTLSIPAAALFPW